MDKVKFCTLNVNGLQKRDKFFRVEEWFKNMKAHICFLQETHFTESVLTDINNLSKFNFYCNNFTSASRGVAICIKKCLNVKIINEKKDEDGRFLLLNIELDNTVFTLVCIYAPNDRKQRNAYFKRVNTMVKDNSLGIIVMGGDFNDALNPIDRKLKSKRDFIKPVNNLKLLIQNNKLVDVWRNLQQQVCQFTWKRRNNQQASRIDMIFIEKTFLHKCLYCKIHPALINSTDHQGVSLNFQTGSGNKGRGYWKLNNSVLTDNEYICVIRHLIEKYKILFNNNEVDVKLLWDTFKIEVRDCSIDFCRNKAKTEKRRENNIEQRLDYLIKMRDGSHSENVGLNSKIANLETELENIHSVKAKGAQIRAREQWTELGEKNNSYFLGLEKKRQINKTITKLKNESGEIITDQSDLLKLQKDFYERLYTSTNPNEFESQEYVESTFIENKLIDEDSKLCEGKISIEECSKAINDMKVNKSPGMDGITVEFYQTFWPQIQNMMIQVYNKSYEDKILPFSHRQSLLSLIFKKGDHLSLKNYRPISLLNTDLKILSRCLAQRLKVVLHKIIHSDQNGYIKNRYIGFNLRQIQDVIDYCDQYQIDGAIIFVDFSKAFDSLEWNFMKQVLVHFGFKQSFIQWVNLMYTDIYCSIANNGWISERFKCTRGIRQGCPLSALLFVLAVEIMAIRIRNNSNVKGIQVKLDTKTHNLKISQLADDTTLFLGSKDEIVNALNLIETFGTFSGLKLNREKTEGIWVGKLKSCKDKVGGVNFSEKPVKALGIYFGHNKEECDKLNWEKRINKVESLITSWKKRNLTILGKILIIRSLILPIFTFLASSTVISCIQRKQLERILFEFIWNGKRDKIKRNTIIGNFEEGGLKMPDVESYFDSLKLSWILRINTDEKANWKVIPTFFFDKFGRNLLIFKMNIGDLKNVKDLEKIPPFYKELIRVWIKIGGGRTNLPTNYREIRKQLLWGNHFIKHNNKCIIFNNFIKSGILYVNDILDNNGNISQEVVFNKLKYRTNWISEFFIIKSSIPIEWKEKCKTEESKNTKININQNILKIDNQDIDLSCQSSKSFYNQLKKLKFEPPIGFQKWMKYFDIETTYPLRMSLNFIFNYLIENKLKMFRWKLMNYILPNKFLLFQWKMIENNLCQNCQKTENYEHFYIECLLLQDFWEKVRTVLRNCHLNIKISLKNIVIGYKIQDQNYYALNYFFTVLAFSIYKRYYLSEQNTKNIDCFEILTKECMYREKMFLKNHLTKKIYIALINNT